MPVAEKVIQRDIDRVHKYNLLKGFSHFVGRSKTAEGYTHEQMLLDLDPYIKYHEDFNLKNSALECIERDVSEQKPDDIK